MATTDRLLKPVRTLFSGSHVSRRRAEIATLVLAAIALQLVSGVGMSFWSGFSRVGTTLDHFQSIWLTGVIGGLVISFFGYFFAYRGVFTVEGGRLLDRRTFLAIVAAGFGGFLAHGGGRLDRYAMEEAGIDRRDATARIEALAGVEHGVLGLIGWGCALAVLAMGRARPPADFSWPWSIIPLPGFAFAFWYAKRYRDRFDAEAGWRSQVGVFLDAVLYARALFLKPRTYWSATMGMALFWAADAVAVWCGMRAFGFAMNPAAMFVGFATGMVFTRRTGPLGGAGVLTCTVPLTLWYSGAAFAPAVVGFFSYQVFSLWLPLPFSLASLDTLRRFGDGHEVSAETKEGEPSLREAG